MLGLDFKVVSAVFRKDMRQYLGNPTGYVFLTLFIATTAAAAFLQEGFFARNLADLAELNRMMPAILMFFVPAITMAAWADERRAGTDELMLTMPVRDAEVVLGKYLGVLGMYTVALAFALAHVGVLAVLGDPDPGLMVATYFGYWLMGALFCAVGLVASMFTHNPTVAFILGAVGCAGLVFAASEPWASGLLGSMLLGLLGALVWLAARGQPRGAAIAGAITAGVVSLAWLAEVLPWVENEGGSGRNWFLDGFGALSVEQRFASFGEGVVRLGDVLYFAGGVVALLYLAAFLLGRRQW
jgi:ABC-type transport system involved in multi-copper enzyme maturation permease subunit